MASMAATPSIKVIKSMSYRGSTRLYSNRYHFNGGTPADGAHWTTFSDAVTAAEKAIFASSITIVQTIGYAAGSDVPVFTKTYSLAGTMTVGTQLPPTGDSAAMVRYSTAARTPKNHPVYLFNYYHGARTDAGAGDTVGTTQKSVLSTYCNLWLSGFSDGTLTLVRAGPNGATATGVVIPTYLTHRDFPR